ncbi:tetraspanin-19-like [Impatiens glandulifera]|uniref:tetraspanin-19-like n=1 Tax=Impatiens glandulifera TaxID=253017 RepID=UPI001FB134EB|nr:tetraspanin-19-like [Impatiens glandulifera]
MKSFFQICLKVVNFTIGILGFSIVLYSLWMIRFWQREVESSSSHLPLPWFIHGFLGMGIALMAVTCFGHIAASTANSHCLNGYMIVIFIVLLAETALLADVILNSDWEKDLPDDESGVLEDFKDFIESNIETCKWLGLLILLAKGCCILLATVLRTLPTENNKHQHEVVDDEYYNEQYSAPFMGHPVYYPSPFPSTTDMLFVPKTEPWEFYNNV